MLRFSLSHTFSDDHDMVKQRGSLDVKDSKAKMPMFTLNVKRIGGTTMTHDDPNFQKIQVLILKKIRTVQSQECSGLFRIAMAHLLGPCFSGSSLFLPDQPPNQAGERRATAGMDGCNSSPAKQTGK